LWRNRVMQFFCHTRGFMTEFSTREFIEKSVYTTNVTPQKTLFIGDKGPYMLYHLHRNDQSTLDFRYGVVVEVWADGSLIAGVNSLPDDGSDGVGPLVGNQPFIFAGEKLEIKVRASRDGFGGYCYASICRFKYKAVA